jgi:hypothetical protein
MKHEECTEQIDLRVAPNVRAVGTVILFDCGGATRLTARIKTSYDARVIQRSFHDRFNVVRLGLNYRF